MKDWLWHWGPAIIVMVIIFIASATPGSDLPKFGTWDLFAKKGGHMLGYALLASAYVHGMNKGGKTSFLKLMAAVCLAGLYAASDEFHQRFTPGRTPSIYDVCIDTVGAGIGVSIWSWLCGRLSKYRMQKSEVRSQKAEY